MAAPTITTIDKSGQASPSGSSDTSPIQASAVSWSAILAGAAAIAALSLILVMLGTGLGLSSVSPWAYSGISAMTFGVTTILWLTFTQFFASGFGGYLTGRLRTKWIGANADEVYFRDTAHGFLAWAVATLTTAAVFTSVIGSVISGGIQAGATVAEGVATTSGHEMTNSGTDNNSMDYFIDSLFRKDIGATSGGVVQDASAATSVTSTLEVARIFINAIQMENLPAEDTRYVGQIVAQHTDLTQQDAEKRVRDTFVRIQGKLQKAEAVSKEAADQARQAFTYASLWLFVSLLFGAFVASFAAIYGGRQRDL